MVVNSYPSGLVYSSDMSKVAVSSNVAVNVQLKRGEDTILDEIYIPDEAGSVVVDLTGPVEEDLGLKIPDADRFEQNEAMKDFMLILVSGSDTRNFPFRAIRGGIDSGSAISLQFFETNFLTKQTQQKRVAWDQPEWLTYYAARNCELRVIGYYAEDTAERTVADLAAGKIYSVNMIFSRISGLFSEQPRYFDAAIYDGETRLTYIQRYILTKAVPEDKFYLFENSLGGLDCARFDGALDYTPEFKEDTVLIDSAEKTWKVERKDIRKQSTGWLSRGEVLWLCDLFTAVRKWFCAVEGFIPFVIDKVDAEQSSEDDMTAFEFSWRPGREGSITPIDRDFGEFGEMLEIISPDEQLFFLAPRLIEFPDIMLNDNCLLPIQTPLGGRWYKVSIGQIKEAVGQIVSGKIDWIEF